MQAPDSIFQLSLKIFLELSRRGLDGHTIKSPHCVGRHLSKSNSEFFECIDISQLVDVPASR